MKSFGRELYRIIEQKKLVKKHIADSLGMSSSQFSQLMKKDVFDPRILERICMEVGVSPGYFFDDWTSEKYTIGDISQSMVGGNATVNVGSDVEGLRAVIAEKERLIQVLLKQLGLSDAIDSI